MELTPDKVFFRMEWMRPKRQLHISQPQAVYVPTNVRSSSYNQLMASHDRMGTRHIS